MIRWLATGLIVALLLSVYQLAAFDDDEPALPATKVAGAPVTPKSPGRHRFS